MLCPAGTPIRLGPGKLSSTIRQRAVTSCRLVSVSAACRAAEMSDLNQAVVVIEVHPQVELGFGKRNRLSCRRGDQLHRHALLSPIS
jgi:hypothetical protein